MRKTDTEKESAETEADEDISRISGVTWKLDIGEATNPGISRWDLPAGIF